jgi:hypothetical protein
MAWNPLRLASLVLVPSLIAACSGNPDGAMSHQCSNGLDAAYAELTAAEAQGFGGTVDWTKAASLLTAAKVQYEFEKYPNCIDKVGRARVYIKRASGG